MTLKEAIDTLAVVRQEKAKAEKQEKELADFVKANMTGITAYGAVFAATLVEQVMHVLDQKLIPADAIELYKVDKTITKLVIARR